MENEWRNALKHVRKSKGLTIPQAAEMAGIVDRCWSSYETDEGNASAKKPRVAALKSFFMRAGVELPEVIKQAFKLETPCKVISVCSSKGGVGKSPITIDIAAFLITQGKKVAIIINDVVYRSYAVRNLGPKPNTFVSQIDFFDERDVLFSKSEIRELSTEIKEFSMAPAEYRLEYDFVLQELKDNRRRKSNAKIQFKEALKTYDYVFLDINHDISLAKKHAHILAIILDTNCCASVWSAEKLILKLQGEQNIQYYPSVFGLMTKCNFGACSPELEEAIGDSDFYSESDYHHLDIKKIRNNEVREAVLAEIKSLQIPMLFSRLTSAHMAVIDRFNLGLPLMDRYAFFDSVIDHAPNSFTADEIEQLAREITGWRN